MLAVPDVFRTSKMPQPDEIRNGMKKGWQRVGLKSGIYFPQQRHESST